MPQNYDNEEAYTFPAESVNETEDAVLLEFGDDCPKWFPKSICSDNGDGTYTCPEWMAISKGVE